MPTNPQGAEASETEKKLVHPAAWFPKRFPLLVRKFGDAIHVEKSERNGNKVYTFAALNEDFFANLLGELGSPESPTVFAVDENRFLTYQEDLGIFVPVLPESLMLPITTLLRECRDYYASSPSVDTQGLVFHLSKKRALDGVVAKAKAFLAVQSSEFFGQANQKSVACANGVLDLDTYVLQPFSPKLRLRSKLPIKYDPDAACPRFEGFIRSVFSLQDDREVMQEFFGQCLTGYNWSQRLVVLNGDGGIGKGTLSNVIRGVLGSENFASLRVGQLGERFELGRLRGKWLAFDGDAPSDLLSGRFAYVLKGITGDDYMTFELKGSNERPSQRMAINVLCCTNMHVLIKLSGDETAWSRRLIYMMDAGCGELFSCVGLRQHRGDPRPAVGQHCQH